MLKLSDQGLSSDVQYLNQAPLKAERDDSSLRARRESLHRGELFKLTVSRAPIALPEMNQALLVSPEQHPILIEEEHLFERDLLGQGLRFPAGGLENGILDFPTTLEGRWVYLCWRRGEVQISHWHELEGGFRGRQELTDENTIAMGRLDEDIPDDSGLDFPPVS